MSKRWDRRILSLSLIAIISNASYTTIAPILPLEIAKHHISERWTSIIFLAFPIGCTVVSFVAAKRLEEVGAEKVMTFGMTMMSVLFYCLSYVFQLVDGSSQLMNDEQTKATDRSLLVAGLTITQFFIGASMSMITTGYYSTATLIFPSAKESALSCIETSVGLGYIIGPIVGSALYDEMGYQSAYRCVSFVVMVMASILWKFLTAHLKQTDDYDVIPEDLAESDDHIEEDDDNVEAQHFADKPQSMNLTLQHHRNINNNHKMNPTTFSLLKQPQIFCAAMSILWINVSWSFLEPILAKRLELFQVGKKGIGIIFALSNVVYVPTAFLMQFIPKRCEKHLTITIALALTPIGVLLVGSNSFVLVIVGILSLGLLPTPVWILLLPSIQKDASRLFVDPSVKRCVNDLTAGIYSSFMVLGQIVGYVFGPMLNESYGMKTSSRVVAALIFTQSLVYHVGVNRTQPKRKP
jgi:MFS family permease